MAPNASVVYRYFSQERYTQRMTSFGARGYTSQG
ncbi:unnamed protein product [Penicillium camemberti]|uniref:Str. FM013 n=1 Tax=Penicillium camemberti (strain FM 013) TaxID=1429867 RepID=A0A0G4NSV5_PENC3|nr:unnamed protein product [Penicillium camemberti]